MRENKFKAWNKEQKEMIQLKGIHRFDTINENTVLLQYTGLKDKNGVEIYKGDIIEAESIFSNKRYPFEVTFSEGCYWMAEYEPLYKSNDVIDSDWKNIKVIGNIFENPELLKL